MVILNSVKKILEIYLLFYLIVFMGFRYQIADPSLLQINIIVILVLLVIWLVYLLIENQSVALPLYPGIFIAFGLSYLTSVVHSIDVGYSITEGIIFSIAVLIFIGVISLIQYRRERRALINSLLWVGMIYNALKIIQMLDLWELRSCVNRGVLLPNKTAGFVVLVMVVALSLLLDQNQKNKWLPGTAFISSALIVFTIGSRGGHIGAVAGCAVVLLLHCFYTGKFTTFGVVAVAGIMIIYPVAGTLLFRPPECTVEGKVIQTNNWNTSITTRYELWETAVDITKEYPILGAGPGTFPLLAGPIYDYNDVAWHSHNLYLNILAERGIAGFIMGSFLILTMIKILLEDKKDPLSKMIGLGALAVFLGQGLVDMVTSEPFIMRYLFAILAVAIGPRLHKKGDSKNAENY